MTERRIKVKTLPESISIRSSVEEYFCALSEDLKSYKEHTEEYSATYTTMTTLVDIVLKISLREPDLIHKRSALSQKPIPITITLSEYEYQLYQAGLSYAADNPISEDDI